MFHGPNQFKRYCFLFHLVILLYFVTRSTCIIVKQKKTINRVQYNLCRTYLPLQLIDICIPRYKTETLVNMIEHLCLQFHTRFYFSLYLQGCIINKFSADYIRYIVSSVYKLYRLAFTL